MDEKQFLKLFADFLQERDLHLENELQKKIEDFLIEHHKTYKSVWWYKWIGKERELEKAQARITLNNFISYLDIHLDEEYLDAKIDEWLNERYK